MPRRARLSIPGIPWHIVQRGNNRAPCFFDTQDYFTYLQYLAEYSAEFECAIHAYVLMTNHVHLLVTPEKADGPARLMKRVGQRYVQHVNRLHGRSGTLWQGRFHSCLTQTERYVLSCYRYIELNPVRAGMVAHPREYRWSSYQCNAEGKADPLLSPQGEYLRLGFTADQRRSMYRELFNDTLGADRLDEIRRATAGNTALGSTRFQMDVARALGRRATRREPGRPRKSHRADDTMGEQIEMEVAG